MSRALAPARVRALLLGERRARRALLGGLGAVLAVASLAFVLGADTGVSLAWVAFALAVAALAGAARAGLLPTALALCGVCLWWVAFPPLVGLLTGHWTPAGRYAYPRSSALAYASASAELAAALRVGARLGLVVAAVGSVAYASGVAARRVGARVR